MKKFLRLITSRAFLCSIFVLLQFVLLFSAFEFLSNYFAVLLTFYSVLSVMIVFRILNRDIIPEYKITWIILILLMPLFGTILYLLLAEKKYSRKKRKHIRRISEDNPIIVRVLPAAKEEDAFAANISDYIYNVSGFPRQTAVALEYYDIGEKFFEALKRELRLAEKFIFIEFFIIKSGKMWDEIYGILLDKVRSGVNVKLMYDDLGTLVNLPRNFVRKLQEQGIEVVVFNKVKPMIDVQMNNRSHRKIVVIDGKTAFSGGVNIGDEYINHKKVFGHWKDTGFMFKGEAVNNFTKAFLELYIGDSKKRFAMDGDFSKYYSEPEQGNIFIQPFYDSPLDEYNVFQEVYIKLISNAKRYVYINTPYLIIDSQMKAALINAAQSGVDIRIVIPGIPDKKYAYSLALANAAELCRKGVKVYKYSPGFIHAKSFVCDDKYVVIGTANLDYRSLFLHFECGAFIADEGFADKLKTDYLETLEKCNIIDSTKKPNIFRRVHRSLLKLLAPLL